ncbi:hypothetical protein D3C79_1074370 [compost metagenome]
MPILISVSDAPGSYFFWAKAVAWAARAKTAAQAANRVIVILSPRWVGFRSQFG